MSAIHKRIIIWVVMSSLIAIGIVMAYMPKAVTVDLASIERTPMMVTIDEEAETRIHDMFEVSAPVAGHVRRIEVHVGDTVIANETQLVSIEPTEPRFLDQRSEAQARAGVQAAQSARSLAQAVVEEALAEHEFADIDHRRARELASKGTISQRDLDAAERTYKTSRAALATAQSALRMREFELQQTKAQLLSPADTLSADKDCACIDLVAPTNGQVLEITNQSERVVTAGETLLQIGNPQDMEIVADYLSTDAVQIKVGQRVVIENWGGATPLDGIIRRVEPFGFTKVSALGIEEQRVNVIIDFTSPADVWERLGHGYQVETRVVLWESTDALAVPITALFRDDEHWAVFINDDRRAELRHIELGRRNKLVTEVVAGLSENDQVILHPSDRILEGIKITPRD